MKKIIAVSAVVLLLSVLAAPVYAGTGENGKTGEKLFREYCSVCHPDGGNIINDKKTLKKTSLKANGVKTAADIVRKMREPGPGMKKFDTSEIGDKDANEIARYIQKTFK